MTPRANASQAAAIVLNWNGLADTIQCVDSVLAMEPPVAIVVVDNGSAGDDVAQLRSRYAGRIHVIANGVNLGFAAGMNRGIRYALDSLGVQHVMLLNNDLRVDPGFGRAMLDATNAHPAAGVLAAKVLYMDRPDVIWYAGGWMHIFGMHGHRGQGRKDEGQYDLEGPTGYAPFAAVLLTAVALRRVGLLCETYFFLWEDLDYCAFVRRAGLSVLYVPQAKAWHKVGASSTKGEWAYGKLWHGMRGRITFRRRYLSRPLYLLYLAWFWLALMPAHAAHHVLVQRDPRRVPTMVSGAWAGMRGTPATGPSGATQ